MSDLTVATNDLESDGLEVGYVVLEGNLETAPTVELEGDLEVGIGGGVESSDLLKIKGMTATEITLPTGMNARYSLDSLFFHNTTIQKVIIPTDITRIGDKAFAHATSLKTINSETDGEVVLWQGLTEIGDSAFQDCPAIVSADLEDSNISRIGYGTFLLCTHLQSVKLPFMLSEVGVSAFQTTALESITIPPMVYIIRSQAFDSCSSLVEINFGNERSLVPTLENANAFHTDNPTTIADRKIIVPDDLYDSWIAADGWNEIKDWIVRYSDYYN